jgi:hypothetical protein
MRDQHTAKAEIKAAGAPTPNTFPNDAALWEDSMAGIKKGLQELNGFQQTAFAANTNTQAGALRLSLYEYHKHARLTIPPNAE